MKFTELTVSTTTDGSELVADALWNYTSYGVAISDVKDVLDLIENRAWYFDYIDEKLTEEKSGAVLVKAYIPLDIAAESRRRITEDLKRLKETAAFSFGSLETVAREVDGDEWIDIWKKHFRPIKLGKIVVCPEWIKYEAAADEQKVLLDSNMAFGTGEHETTSMVIELMQKYSLKGKTVVDVGCGSGILGISAVKLGAEKAFLTDIDYVAVESAKHNAALNGVADKTEVVLNNLLDGKQVRGDMVVANITAEILAKLSEQILTNIEKGGTLILSGIILEKRDFVRNIYESVGFKHIETITRGEWSAQVYRFL